MASDDFEPRLISQDQHDELDAAVRTLAEQFYECGFGPERALDMAWALAMLPELVERVEQEEEEDW